MSDTPNLSLPLLAAGQAQKHVTHNEALQALDTLLHCAVLDRDLATPPAAPDEGERYIVAAGSSGAWNGRAGQIAAWRNGAWAYHVPAAGFLVYLVDEATLLLHDGSSFVPATPASLSNLTRIGIGTAADAANPFAAKLNAALWTARPVGEGGSGDLRYTLNKDGPARVLSLLFQSGYSGRAELGLVGDDDLQLKVSADGSAWGEAIRVKGTGRVGLGTASVPERLTVGGNIAPALDNAYTVGTASLRPSAIYGATGVINTSDIRAKCDVEAIDPGLALSLLAAVRPISFRWQVGGVVAVESSDGIEVEHRPGRRRHFGWSAQEWRDALDGAGQDAGLLVKLDPTDPEGELALRPDQIVAVLHAALLNLRDEVARLSARPAQGGQPAGIAGMC